MLNLAVQSPVRQVHQGDGVNVAAGQDLLSHVVQPHIGVQHRHSLVVGGKYQPHVQARQCAMRDDENHGMPGRHEQERNGEIQTQADCDRRHFGHRVAQPLPTQEIADAFPHQYERGQRVQRIQEEGLVFHYEPDQSPAPQRASFSEGVDGNVDVVVQFQLVWISVVGIVLLQPPAGGDTRHEPGKHQDKVVVPRGTENLAVAGVMPDEIELHEHHSHERRGRQSDPQLINQDDDRNSQRQRRQSRENDGRVVPILSVQQALLGHPSAEFQILLAFQVQGRVLQSLFQKRPVGGRSRECCGA